jgi:hypothetical protein
LLIATVKEVYLVELSAWRDIILIIGILVASLSTLFIAVILFMFYRKTISLLQSSDLMVAKVSDIVDYVNKEVVRPVSRFGTMFQGIMQGVSIFGSIFNKKEVQDD